VHVAVVLPPTKTSHELDTLAAAPDARVTVLADPTFHPAATHPLESRRLPWLGSPRRWTAALAWLRGLQALEPSLRQSSISVVVSLELFSVGTRQAARLARRLDVPHFVFVTEVLDDNPLYRIPPWRGNARRAVRTLDGVLCWNDAGARHAASRGVPLDRMVVISPGVDTSLFCPPETETSRPSAITVGELRPDKGVMDVIAATELALDRLPDDFELVVIGDGPLRDEVETAAMSRPWLKVRGQLPRAQVATELGAARAFMLAPHSRPFWAEQFGFAVVEAMACGLPVVVTRCGALGDVVPPHNPVVDERDLTALADGLIQAMSPVGREWGLLNRAAVERCYDLTTQGARLGEHLARASGEPPAQGDVS
jgi:phosphatidyl-myo-inositol dimannoside synthase